MRSTVYYHWWAGPEEEPKYSNLRAPLLLSIATLRAVNPDCNIVVLDSSKESSEGWGQFPQRQKLGFHIMPVPCYLEKYQHLVKGWQHLSRLFDLRRHVPEICNVVYCDADVFWLRDPFPLSGDLNKFCYDGHNTGLFYYDPDHMQIFFDIFEAITISSIVDRSIRDLVKETCPYDAWHGVWDEMITSHMRVLAPELFHIIPTEEHVTCRNIHQADPATAKMFHCNGTMVNNYFPKREGEREHSRGLMCLLIKEFHDNICKVLDVDDLSLIFTPDELQFYVSRQFSLFDLDKWDKMKTEDGHCHIKHVFRPPKTII